MFTLMSVTRYQSSQQNSGLKVLTNWHKWTRKVHAYVEMTEDGDEVYDY